MKLTIRKPKQTVDPRDLANIFALRGYDKYRAWDMYITATGLKPEINAKEFYKIFANANPARANEFDEVEVDYTPTHIDILKNMECQITERADGVFEIMWENGQYGSNPPDYPPEEDRFLKMGGGK